MDYDRYEIEDDSYYLFTCAELKAREYEFVERARFERMLESEDMDSFLKVLGETVYSPSVPEISSGSSFEKVMTGSYGIMLDYLEERLRDEHKMLSHILFFEEILHNMKVILKSVVLREDLSGLFIPVIYDWSQLTAMYGSGDDKDADTLTGKLISYLKDVLEKPGEKDYRKVELGFEKFYSETMAAVAAGLNRKMVSEYMSQRIDLINIENIYRWKQMGEKKGFDDILHNGGNISMDILKGFKSETMDYTVRELERTDYANIVIRGAQSLALDSSFSSFERNRDLYFLDYFDNFKYSISNLEKIFHFFLKKKIELTHLNILFTGILYNAERSNIKRKID
ncbi:MAG: V-type ATPase subunit [Actinobacteria bacterium]|jgi:V/A-type H+-transporting ATPase subunit C|nr:V-type ATPase subunit [Actinomycetota bacterium]